MLDFNSYVLKFSKVSIEPKRNCDACAAWNNGRIRSENYDFIAKVRPFQTFPVAAEGVQFVSEFRQSRITFATTFLGK